MPVKIRFISVVLAISTALAAQSIPPTSASTAATKDTSYIDPQGTAYVTRVVPVPPDLSPEARKSLIRILPDQGPPESLEHRRAQMEVSPRLELEVPAVLGPSSLPKCLRPPPLPP